MEPSSVEPPLLLSVQTKGFGHSRPLTLFTPFDLRGEELPQCYEEKQTVLPLFCKALLGSRRSGG